MPARASVGSHRTRTRAAGGLLLWCFCRGEGLRSAPKPLKLQDTCTATCTITISFWQVHRGQRTRPHSGESQQGHSRLTADLLFRFSSGPLHEALSFCDPFFPALALKRACKRRG